MAIIGGRRGSPQSHSQRNLRGAFCRIEPAKVVALVIELIDSVPQLIIPL